MAPCQRCSALGLQKRRHKEKRLQSINATGPHLMAEAATCQWRHFPDPA